MTTHWWRAYDEAVDDPKIQLMPGPLFKAWFNLLCIASGNGGKLPPAESIAFKLRTSEAKIGSILDDLVLRGLLDDFDGTLRPHNWSVRQFKSDLSTERVKRFRNGKPPVSETPPETDTDTEPERKKEREPALKRRALSTVDEWVPSSEALLLDFSGRELEKMRDWARSKGERRADWEATFRNWARRSAEQKSNGGIGGNDRSSNGFKDALGRLGDRIHELEDGNPEGGAAVVRLLPDRRRQ